MAVNTQMVGAVYAGERESEKAEKLEASARRLQTETYISLVNRFNLVSVVAHHLHRSASAIF